MIAAGPENRDPGWWKEAVWVGVLVPDGQDRSRDEAPVGGGRPFPEGRLLFDGAPWLRWFDLQLDHLGNERNGIGVQPVEW